MRSRSTGMVIIYVTEDKSKNSLHPIILNHVAPSNIIYSDKMASYVTRTDKSHLKALGYEHCWVNHSYEWVVNGSRYSRNLYK